MQWQDTGAVPPRNLSGSRLQLHYGALVLGSAAHAVLEHLDDDSQTNLAVDRKNHALCTRPLEPENGTVMCLNMLSLTLVLRSDEGVIGAFPLDGRTLQEAFDWAGRQLGAVLDRDVVVTRREYPDFAESPLGSGARFERRADDELRELAAWFENGLELFEGLRASHPSMSEARVWPHHFDLGVLVPFEGDAMIGAGMSPGDHSYDQPYLYCSPYPRPDEGAGLPDLARGHWHTDGFTSAVLTAEQLVSSTSQAAGAREYLASAVAACSSLLS